MNVTVTVHIKNLHVHVGEPAATVEAYTAALPAFDLANLAAGLGKSPEDVEVVVNSLRSAPAAAPADAPTPPATEPGAAAGTVIQLPATRRRRKSSVPEDTMADLIEQARQMAMPAPAADSAAPSAPEANDETATEPEPEADPSGIAHKPTTGEVVKHVAPDAPELTVIRDGLRALGFGDTVKAMAFLGELVGRPITRLGELDTDDVRDVVSHLTANGVVR